MEEKIMSLITCPECELPVSSRARNCPHCGYPMHPYDPEDMNKKVKRSKRTHLRLPNGFGQITKLNNPNLRNPYRAMITVGKDNSGKPICKILKPQGYFATYTEAYTALVEYNKNPYDLDDVITIKELYTRWSTEYFTTITPSSTRTITSAWAYCTNIIDLSIKELKPRHIKGCIDDCDKASIKPRIKSMFNLMLDYAVEHDLVETNVARKFKTEHSEPEKGHKSFTDEEMALLWKYQSTPFVCFVLLQCYTGWRPQELCNIKISDVDMDQNIIVGGMKTKSGKNRIVPFCDKILPIGKKIYELSKMLGSEYLICDYDGSHFTYDKYYKRFQKVMGEIGVCEHSPHDPRKQFVTMAKSAGVDEYAIKRLVGHSINDITEKVYTDRDLEWLKTEINKINAL